MPERKKPDQRRIAQLEHQTGIAGKRAHDYRTCGHQDCLPPGQKPTPPDPGRRERR